MSRVALIAGFGLSIFLLLFGGKKEEPSLEFPPAEKIEKSVPAEKFQAVPVSFSNLKGWGRDDLLQALPAMRKSCRRTRRQKEWTAFCREIQDRKFKTNKELRLFLEKKLQPYAVDPGKEGLFTGYYEPEIEGCLVRTRECRTPLYGVPEDIFRINLGEFDPKYKGDIVFGRLDGKNVRPYLTRQEIETHDGAFPAEPIVWVRHAADAFVLQIQGSGLIRLPDGKTMAVGYAGNNGRKFVGIGAIMAKRGLLKPGVYTMAEITAWLKQNPVEAEELMHQNPRYIFFRKLKEKGAVGSLGVRLTAGRSMAVDPAYIPLGSVLWLETTAPDGKPMNRLMTAQDTGTAIKGAVRGDFFWGTGEKALKEAGRMRSKGTYFLLVPKKDGKTEIE
jgi:membrane-bound lytic murein transglycosylase A